MDYVIIDTRNFSIRCILIGHQKNHITVLENRQYLQPCEQDVWKKKFPKILEKIENDYPNKKKILLFPESVCLNLTIEIPEEEHFTIEQRIAHVLYKNFHFYPSKMEYKFWNLDKNRYAVILIAKKFLKFIQKCCSFAEVQNLSFFPPFVGLLNYFKNLNLKETSIAVFYEDKLRRFFIKNETEINFIDFYQVSNSSNQTFLKDVKSTQQLIFQSLNIKAEKKELLLFGDVPEELKEIYEQEYQGKVNIIKSLKNVAGFTENISVMAQCLYLGIDELVNEEHSPLSVFNFSSFILQPSIWTTLKQTLKKHNTFVSIILWVWLCIAIFALGCACYKNIILEKQLVAFNEVQKRINSLKKCNKLWKKQNEIRRFFPENFLKFYDAFQTIPGKFCIDGMGIDIEKDKSFCYIKGRIHEDDLAVFEENLFEKLNCKIEVWGEKNLFYRIKIPIKIPKQLR